MTHESAVFMDTRKTAPIANTPFLLSANPVVRYYATCIGLKIACYAFWRNN